MTAATGLVVALLGAESTGKTMLAHALAQALATPQRRVAVVGEWLREFCDREGRTPRRDEQAGIAARQTERIAVAARSHALVIADTTALMTAVYSDLVFGDTSLYTVAQAAHAACDLTLLTALDIAWQADGLQRDGPQVRAPVDAGLRAALLRQGCAFSVVSGQGAARLAAARVCVERLLVPAASAVEHQEAARRWQWHCERCGDAECERRTLLPPTPGP
jgi:nicotinamide riboside kinase